MNEINPGDRVQTRKWTKVHTGTVTNVSDDGESIYVKWDGAAFTEDEMDRAEVERIEGEGDPAAPYAVIESDLPDRFVSELLSGSGWQTADGRTAQHREAADVRLWEREQ